MSLDISVFHIVNSVQPQPMNRAYRLHVTNLEDLPLEYLVEYWHHPLDGLKIRSADFRGVQQTYPVGLGVYVATTRLNLAPQQTGIVELRWAGDGSQPVNVSGNVKMRLPRRRISGDIGALRPQLASLAKVLLHAESVTETTPQLSLRTGYRDKDGYVIGRSASVGEASPLPDVVGIALASGRALNELKPDGAFLIGHEAITKVTESLRKGAEGRIRAVTEDLPDHDRAEALLELLAEVSSDRATLNDLNAYLAKLGSSIQMAASKVSNPKNP